MKIKELQEARLVPSEQNQIVADFLADGLDCLGDPFEEFNNILGDHNGGLNDAVAYVLRWNIAAEFVNKHSDANVRPISKHELEDWVKETKE